MINKIGGGANGALLLAILGGILIILALLIPALAPIAPILLSLGGHAFILGLLLFFELKPDAKFDLCIFLQFAGIPLWIFGGGPFASALGLTARQIAFAWWGGGATTVGGAACVL